MYPATLVGGIINLYIELNDPDWSFLRTVLANIYLEMTYPDLLLEYQNQFTLDQEVKPLDMGIAEQVVNVIAEVNGSATLGTPSGSIAPTAIIINGTEYVLWHWHTITARADDHSTISPSGSTSVWWGNNQAYTFSANSGYAISQVLVDGAPASTTSPYTFTNVKADHNITVTTTAQANDYVVTLSQTGPLYQGDAATIRITTTSGGNASRATFNITKDGSILFTNVTTGWNTAETETELFFMDTEENPQGHTYTVKDVCDTNGDSVNFTANRLDLVWQLKNTGSSGNSGTGDTGDTNQTDTNPPPTNESDTTGELPPLPTIPGLTPEQSTIVWYSIFGVIIIVAIILGANIDQKKKKRKLGRASLSGGVKGFKRSDRVVMKKLKRKT